MKKMHLIIAAAIALVAALVAVNITGTQSQAAIRKVRDCEKFSIINCGALSQKELIRDYDGSAEVQKIYAHYGIQRSDITGKTSEVKIGQVWKNGRITVDGKTVATGAHSVGRNDMPGSHKVRIGGHTYYERSDTRNFASDYIAAFVLMRDGRFYRAIMMSCGNPTVATPTVKPEYKCDALEADKISRTAYRFTADATAKHGADVVEYHFDFGDGKKATSKDKTATHEYAKAGTYKVTLTVEFKVDGHTKTDSGKECETTVKVAEKPVYRCDALNAHLIKKDDNSYEYTLSYTAENGATLKSVDYDFGDGTTVTKKASEAKTVQHSYAEAGTYKTKAVLHFSVNENGKAVVKDVNCETSITISPEMCDINPQYPKDSPKCAPCEIPGKEDFPKDSPECEAVPPELPKTGPGEMIGGSLGLGALIAAGYYWYGSRRNLLSALLNR